MPDRWARKFSAVRSPVSSARASPSSVEHRRGRLVEPLPLRPPALDRDARVEAPEDRLRHVESEQHARRLLLDARAGARAGLDDRLGRQVARADVLGQRARDQVLDGLVEHVPILAFRAAALPLPA